jgi:endoglucanase
MIEEKFSRLWFQVAETLKCKSSMVALETINEPPVNTPADGAEINKLNEIFLAALAESGGYNTQRVVTLTGGSSDGAKTTQWFKPPSTIPNPWALQYHYYSPYDFIFGAWGKSIWGSEADKAALTTDLSIVRGNFTDVPLVIGEFSASSINLEPAARWKYYDHFARTAKSLNTAFMLWDNGGDNFDRAAHNWRDPTSVSIIMAALAGEPNSLPDSTTDAGAMTQSSSAFIWYKSSDPMTDQTLPWLFNGNTLSNITTGSAILEEGTDYSVSLTAITFKAQFISSYVSATESPGIKANLTLTFSAGTPIVVQLVQWNVPILPFATSKAVAGSDLSIPLTWSGFKMVAAVKMQASDGTYLFDDWTQYLPPLQQSRGVSSVYIFVEETIHRNVRGLSLIEPHIDVQWAI